MKFLKKLHAEAIEKAKTEQDKIKAAAVAMIETPMELIKAILLKQEQAAIEVMRELHEENVKLKNREWVGLTDDEEIFDLADHYGEFKYGDAQGHKRIGFARAIEAKLKAKNT